MRETTKRHHNMKLVCDAVRIAQTNEVKKHHNQLHFPLKMPASQLLLFFLDQILRISVEFSFLQFFNAEKRDLNALAHCCRHRFFSFFSQKTENYRTEKMRVTDFFFCRLLYLCAVCVQVDFVLLFSSVLP